MIHNTQYMQHTMHTTIHNTQTNQDGGQSYGRQQVCFRCLQPGHWARECPNVIDLHAVCVKGVLYVMYV